MNQHISRRNALFALAAGSLAVLAAPREALADLAGKLKGATKFLVDLGFSFSAATDGKGGQIIETTIHALDSLQYNVAIDGDAAAQGVTPCISLSYVNGLSDTRFTSLEVDILDLVVFEDKGEAIYQILDKGVAPCIVVETRHLEGVPDFKATHYAEGISPCLITEARNQDGANVIRTTLLDDQGLLPTWIVETADSGAQQSFKATSIDAGISPCVITESVGDAAGGMVKFTVLDQGVAPCMTVTNDSSSGAPRIRAEVEPDADFEITVGTVTYVLVNGGLSPAPV